MARILGGELVGMSTALEAIAARQCGLEVLGISLVTNLAAGIGDQRLSHDEVLEAGHLAAERCGRLLSTYQSGSRIDGDLNLARGTYSGPPFFESRVRTPNQVLDETCLSMSMTTV